MSQRQMSKYLSYEQAGVSIDANDEMVRQICSCVASTFGPRVIELPNSFAGMFRLDYDERLFKRNYKNPVLVACTDGVGSKVQLAAQAKKFDTVGIVGIKSIFRAVEECIIGDIGGIGVL